MEIFSWFFQSHVRGRWNWNFSNGGSGAECIQDCSSGQWLSLSCFIIEVIFLQLFINLFNKYVLSLSTSRFYFVPLWSKQVDWLCINLWPVLNFDFNSSCLTCPPYLMTVPGTALQWTIFLCVYSRFTSNPALLLNSPSFHLAEIIMTFLFKYCQL